VLLIRREESMPLQQSQPTVLVVEDVGLVRLNLALHLQDAGFRVLEAASAEDAIAVLEAATAPVHIVLTDLNMPGSRGGAELLQWLTANRPDIIRAVCSAHAGLRPIEEVSAANLVFEKPFDAGRLSRDLWAALAS
jgi:CheY-like chemotaxis protein